jgi:hypothetical protein
MPMSLNDNHDVIRLIGPGNVQRDIFAYSSAQEGVVIETGH